jgi:signal recognition particle receptor subunit beta
VAQLDPERSRIVIRLVYDGPAWAGKTTSLRHLARSLGSSTFSGEEADGRTLHFDWVDYVGGLFQGLPIRCQIVGVPGQRVLERRRRLLLETADAVVFVADSRPGQMDENLHAFTLLNEVHRDASPPVAVVVQANKRDLAGVVSLEELRERLGGGPSLAMTESVAERGEGIRETFVLAVRLALDRVRALWNSRDLLSEGPAIDSGQSLLTAMLAAEGEVPQPLPSASPLQAESAAADDLPLNVDPPAVGEQSHGDQSHGGAQRGPWIPDPSVPAGLVWPPVNGRVTVHEATRGTMTLTRSPSGDWIGSLNSWRLLSPVQALYFDLEEGRQALIGWARWHTAAGAILSPSRAIVLTKAAPSAWRLWQIVGGARTLRDTCRDLVARSDRAVGEALFRIIDLRLRAQRDFVSSGWLAAVDLETVGASEVGEPMFTGFAPFSAELPRVGVASHFDELRLIEEELGPALKSELSLSPARLPGVLAGVQLAASAKERRHVADAIRKTLLSA